MSYWFYNGSEGRKFNWEKQPTYTCPLDQDDAARVSDAAELLHIPAHKLVEVLKRAHKGRYSGRARTQDGKLTDRCAQCGHKMHKRGFRAWITRPAGPGNDDARPGIFLAGTIVVTEKTIYFDTRKEAQTWAYDESRKDQRVREKVNV